MKQLERTSFLYQLGQRIRQQRLEMKLTLRQLAEDSGVSLRFLTSLESGEGNISVVRLAQICSALRLPMKSLFDFNMADEHKEVIALLGLRGAGKSTLGSLLAQQLGLPFFELDDLIEDAAGLQLSEIFSLHGEAYYRRMEREALTYLLDENPQAVLATGGGIVTESETFEFLKNRCVTVWLRAQPEDHMKRVLAQGDQRPVAGRPHAMAELRDLLTSREQLYSQAHIQVETTQCTPQDTLEDLLPLLEEALHAGHQKPVQKK